MKRYIRSSKWFGEVDLQFSAGRQEKLEQLALQGKFDDLVQIIKSDSLCKPILSVHSDMYTVNYRDYTDEEVAKAKKQMFKLMDNYITENLTRW